LQLTQDEIKDVVIGGRGAQLLAIDSANGSVLHIQELLNISSTAKQVNYYMQIHLVVVLFLQLYQLILIVKADSKSSFLSMTLSIQEFIWLTPNTVYYYGILLTILGKTS